MDFGLSGDRQRFSVSMRSMFSDNIFVTKAKDFFTQMNSEGNEVTTEN